MNAKETMEALLAGKKVRRPEWRIGAFLYLKDGLILDEYDFRAGLCSDFAYEVQEQPTYSLAKAMEFLQAGKCSEIKRKNWSNVSFVDSSNNSLLIRDAIANDWVLVGEPVGD